VYYAPQLAGIIFTHFGSLLGDVFHFVVLQAVCMDQYYMLKGQASSFNTFALSF